MQHSDSRENVTVNFGVAVGVLMIFYAAAVELFGLDRVGSRNLFVVSLAGVSIAVAIRVVRFRHLGISVLIKSVEPVRESDRPRLLLGLVYFGLLGGYASRELLVGSFAVGFLMQGIRAVERALRPRQARPSPAKTPVPVLRPVPGPAPPDALAAPGKEPGAPGGSR